MLPRRPVAWLLFAAVAALLFAAGCGYGDDDDDEATPTHPAQAVPRLPEAEAGAGTVPVDDFNDYLEQARPAFAISALRTAIEFADAGAGKSATTSVHANEGPEGNGNEASVTVTRDGLPDDSIRALRYQIVLDRAADGTWRLRSAQRAQRCQPNRGHQEFSTELCT